MELTVQAVEGANRGIAALSVVDAEIRVMFEKKRMVYFFLNIFFLFSFHPFSFMEGSLTISLSHAENISLQKFLQAFLLGSQGGYVLYGDKPICCEGCVLGHLSNPFRIGYYWNILTSEGVRVWKKLKIPRESEKFLWIIQDFDEKHPLLLLINKKALKETFENHAALFRHLLGPQLTVDQLIDRLRHQAFFSVVKDDNALIGLLLGFGLTNSLYVSRSEQISQILFHSTYSHVPEVFYKTDRSLKPPYIPEAWQPSWGYASLEEEWEDLNQKIEFASEALENYSPKLTFGRLKGQQEDVQLIKNYEDAQLKILKVFEDSQWLEHVLSHFCGEDVTLKIEEKKLEALEVKGLSLIKLISFSILQGFEDSFGDDPSSSFSEYVEGLQEADKRKDAHYISPFPKKLEALYPSKSHSFFAGFKAWSFYKFHQGTLLLGDVLKEVNCLRSQKVHREDFPPLTILHYFQKEIADQMDNHEHTLAITDFMRLEKTKGVQCLVKDRLYYQPLKKGSGSRLGNNAPVKIVYTLETREGNVIKKEAAFLDLKRCIKSFRQSLPNMKKGEQGILYIHPDWGIKDYFSPPYFSPYLIAKFEIP